MALTTAIVVGTTAAASAYSSRQARNASRAQTRSSRDAIAAAQDSESRALEIQRPFYEAGYTATAAMMDMAGLPRTPRTAISAAEEQSDERYLGGSWLSGPFRGIRRAIETTRNPETGAYEADPSDLSSYPKYNWQTDPGYEFRLGEGARAIERSAASRGILQSGGTLRGIERYAQDYASNEYQRVFDRIATIAGRGQSAANAGSNVVVNTGQTVGNAIVNAGEARASGYVAQGNAWSNFANQAGMFAGVGGFGSGGSQPMAWNYRQPAVGYA